MSVLKFGVIVCALFLLAGCGEEHRAGEEENAAFFKRQRAREEESEASVKRCAETGGMPIRSVWDGRFAGCVYPPQK